MNNWVYFKYDPSLHDIVGPFERLYSSSNMKPCKIVDTQRLGHEVDAEILYIIEFESAFGNYRIHAYKSELVESMRINLRERACDDGTIAYEKKSETVEYL